MLPDAAFIRSTWDCTYLLVWLFAAVQLQDENNKSRWFAEHLIFKWAIEPREPPYIAQKQQLKHGWEFSLPLWLQVESLLMRFEIAFIFHISPQIQSRRERLSCVISLQCKVPLFIALYILLLVYETIFTGWCIDLRLTWASAIAPRNSRAKRAFQLTSNSMWSALQSSKL